MNESCWKGYKQIGMKKKGGRTVPNCVKENKFSFAEWLNENKEQYQGDSNPMDNTWVDTWHEAQKHAFSGNTQLAVSMMEKAAQQAWQESPGEAKYYLGTAAWLSDDKAKCLAMTKDNDVIQTGNDKVLRRLLNSKTSNYQHAYSLNENEEIDNEFFSSLVDNAKHWIPLNDREAEEFWQNETDLVDRWDISSPEELHKVKLKTPVDHIEKLKNYDDSIVDFYNSFDIWLKNKYKMDIIDFIDYDSGVVYLIKPIKHRI